MLPAARSPFWPLFLLLLWQKKLQQISAQTQEHPESQITQRELIRSNLCRMKLICWRKYRISQKELNFKDFLNFYNFRWVTWYLYVSTEMGFICEKLWLFAYGFKWQDWSTAVKSSEICDLFNSDSLLLVFGVKNDTDFFAHNQRRGENWLKREWKWYLRTFVLYSGTGHDIPCWTLS